jgi:hypothetical protein
MHCISAPYTYQQVVSRSDGEEVNLPEEEGGYEVATAVANDEEGEDGEGEGGYSYVKVRTAMLDVKRTAVIALGMLAESAGPAFAAYLQPAMEALHNQRDYFHAAVKFLGVYTVLLVLLVHTKGEVILCASLAVRNLTLVSVRV